MDSWHIRSYKSTHFHTFFAYSTCTHAVISHLRQGVVADMVMLNPAERKDASAIRRALVPGAGHVDTNQLLLDHLFLNRITFIIHYLLFIYLSIYYFRKAQEIIFAFVRCSFYILSVLYDGSISPCLFKLLPFLVDGVPWSILCLLLFLCLNVPLITSHPCVAFSIFILP